MEIPPYPPNDAPDAVEERDRFASENASLRRDLASIAAAVVPQDQAQEMSPAQVVSAARLLLQSLDREREAVCAALDRLADKQLELDRIASSLADCQADLVAVMGALPADCGEGSAGQRVARVVAQRDELRRLTAPTVYTIKNPVTEEQRARLEAAMGSLGSYNYSRVPVVDAEGPAVRIVQPDGFCECEPPEPAVQHGVCMSCGRPQR